MEAERDRREAILRRNMVSGDNYYYFLFINLLGGEI